MAKDVMAETLAAIGPVDERARAAAHRRWANRAKLEGSLGRMETLGEDLAAIRGTEQPAFDHKAIVVFAGDHGVVEEGVSSYPKEMTLAMLENIFAGGAAVNAFARFLRAELHTVDVGIDAPPLRPRPGFFSRKVARGTRNLAREPAMTPTEAREAARVGIDVVMNLVTTGADIIAVGDLGVGNTTVAGALLAGLTGLPPEKLVGPGIGGTPEVVRRKMLVIASALERHTPPREDPWEVMAALGGLELAAMGGAYLAAASRHVPVIVDGFTGSAAALWAAAVCPGVRPYLIPSHMSEEPGLRVAMGQLGLQPFFDFAFRHGEGTGAALQLGLCDLASRLLREMVAFEELLASRARIGSSYGASPAPLPSSSSPAATGPRPSSSAPGSPGRGPGAPDAAPAAPAR